MDKLKEFLAAMSIDQRISFAARCGTTWPHLRNITYGQREPGEKLCVRIEQESGGVVTRSDLRPGDWAAIWPELRLIKEPTHV